jgi:iron complex transport system substrate-binding protein
MKTPLRFAAVLGMAAACALALAGCNATATNTTGAAASPSGSAASTASAAPTATFPMTVTAGNGAVTIKAKPGRIVSLSPTATEDLYAVGAGSQVVAVDQDSDYPAGVPKTSLSGLTPNIEAIAKYDPSLVIASEDSGGLVAGLAKLGVPVLIEPAVATLGGAYDQIEQIGDVTGHASQGVTVVKGMQTQIEHEVQTFGGPTNMSYYWELSANPFYSATSSTFIGQIVGLFGLTNIADAADKPADGGYPELSQEYIVSAMPQIIFLADSQAADGGQTAAIVEKRPGWSVIPAVQHGEVIALPNDDIASRWGPRIPVLVDEIGTAIHNAIAAQATATATAG